MYRKYTRRWNNWGHVLEAHRLSEREELQFSSMARVHPTKDCTVLMDNNFNSIIMEKLKPLGGTG